MNEPEKVQRARKMVERERAAVEEHRRRILELRAIGAPTDKAEAMLAQSKATLSSFEYGLGLAHLDLGPQPRRGAARRRAGKSR
jgi:hypothetical protein